MGHAPKIVVSALKNTGCALTAAGSTESAKQAADLTIEQLGKEIVARIEAGDRAKTMAEDRYRSAGLLLIEARRRVPVKSLAAFLKDHCAGLLLAHARGLVAIAEGWTNE